MARSVALGRTACLFLLASAALGACEGKTIHLGDGRGGGGGGRDDGGPTCTTAHVPANQVLWIGDSWVLVTGSQHTRVRDLARQAGAIGQNDDYVIGAEPASGMVAISNQYTEEEAGSTKVKVLIMDGGTWDTIMSGGSDSSVNSVAASFGNLLAEVAADGTVEHVIYFLTPELSAIPGVAALRPLLKALCDESTVPCHFIDLQPIWSGHPEYTLAGSVPLPTEAGSQAIADAIWAVMQDACIAQ